MRSRFAIALFLALGCLVGQISAQNVHFGLRAGILGGGPIPNESNPDSSSGSLGVGPSFAVRASFDIGEKWSLHSELGYAFRGATYAQLYRKDTMVTLELIPNVFDTVPSFYYADVNGKMNLHYLELPLFFQYHATQRLRAQGGILPAFLLGGSDKGTAEIQIGEGGVFDDTTTVFNNIGEMNTFDFGVFAGVSYVLPAGFWVEFRGSRSLTRLYQKGFLANRGFENTRLYHTQFYLGVGYRF